MTQVGGVALWLERRSLTGELSLIYAWSMVDIWPLRGLGVRYGSTNQANSAFHPIGVAKWVVIHVITLFTGVETIKRQTSAARVVVWLKGCKRVCAGLAYSL